MKPKITNKAEQETVNNLDLSNVFIQAYLKECAKIRKECAVIELTTEVDELSAITDSLLLKLGDDYLTIKMRLLRISRQIKALKLD